MRFRFIFLIFLFLFYSCFPLVYGDGESWLGTYAYRVPITIDSDFVNSDLTNFPYPVFISSSCGNSSQDLTAVFDEVGNNFMQIAFTESDGDTQLYGDVEYWDNSTEIAIVWVSCENWTIYNASGSLIYLYYDGDASNNTSYITDTKGSAVALEVWNYFESVYHLEEDSTPFVDSLGNSNLVDGNPPTGTSSLIDGCQDFEYANIDFQQRATRFDSGSNNFSFSIWANFESVFNYVAIAGQRSIPLGNYDTAMDFEFWARLGDIGCTIADDDGDGGEVHLYSQPDTGVDYLLSMTYDVSGQTLYFYMNGEEVDSTFNGDWDEDMHLDEQEFYISMYHASYPTRKMDGLLDECRVAYSLLSEDWYYLEYNSGVDGTSYFGSVEEYEVEAEATIGDVSAVRFVSRDSLLFVVIMALAVLVVFLVLVYRR